MGGMQISDTGKLIPTVGLLHKWFTENEQTSKDQNTDVASGASDEGSRAETEESQKPTAQG